MARVIRHTTPMQVEENYVEEETNDREIVEDRSRVVITNIINIIASFVIGLLALRFVLSLLGANRGNPFANFIYDASRPLVQPFFGLFNYQPQFGVVRFEFETLVAIVVYALLFMVISRLVNIDRRQA